MRISKSIKISFQFIFFKDTQVKMRLFLLSQKKVILLLVLCSIYYHVLSCSLFNSNFLGTQGNIIQHYKENWNNMQKSLPINWIGRVWNKIGLKSALKIIVTLVVTILSCHPNPEASMKSLHVFVCLTYEVEKQKQKQKHYVYIYLSSGPLWESKDFPW